MPGENSAGPEHLPALFRIVFHVFVAVGSVHEHEVNGPVVRPFVEGGGIRTEEGYAIKEIAGNEDSFTSFGSDRLFLGFGDRQAVCWMIFREIESEDHAAIGEVESELSGGDSLVGAELEDPFCGYEVGQRREGSAFHGRDRGPDAWKRLERPSLRAGADIENIDVGNSPNVSHGVDNFTGGPVCDAQDVLQISRIPSGDLEKTAAKLDEFVNHEMKIGVVWGAGW